MFLTFLTATVTQNLNLFWIYFFIAFQLFSWITSLFLPDFNTLALCIDSEKHSLFMLGLISLPALFSAPVALTFDYATDVEN